MLRYMDCIILSSKIIIASNYYCNYLASNQQSLKLSVSCGLIIKPMILRLVKVSANMQFFSLLLYKNHDVKLYLKVS